MELYIYDRTAGLADVVDTLTSIRWRRKYFEPGEVEIHLPATFGNMQLLQEGRIIRRTDRREAAIIEGRKVRGFDLAITGRMLSSMLDRALVTELFTMTASADAVLCALAAEGGRVIPELAIRPATGIGTAISVQIPPWQKNALTLMEKIGKASGIGFRVLFTPGALEFETYTGIDRSVRQNDVPRVIFSDEFGNLADIEYTEDVKKHRNVAYVLGAETNGQQEVVVVDQSSGQPVREMYVSGSAVQREEGMTTEAYRALLAEYGAEQLAEKAKVESFEGEGFDVGNFTYMEDWDLGDIVTVHSAELGLVSHARVAEVEELYERGTVRILPVFGSPLPEKLDLGVI